MKCGERAENVQRPAGGSTSASSARAPPDPAASPTPDVYTGLPMMQIDRNSSPLRRGVVRTGRQASLNDAWCMVICILHWAAWSFRRSQRPIMIGITPPSSWPVGVHGCLCSQVVSSCCGAGCSPSVPQTNTTGADTNHTRAEQTKEQHP